MVHLETTRKYSTKVKNQKQVPRNRRTGGRVTSLRHRRRRTSLSSAWFHPTQVPSTLALHAQWFASSYCLVLAGFILLFTTLILVYKSILLSPVGSRILNGWTLPLQCSQSLQLGSLSWFLPHSRHQSDTQSWATASSLARGFMTGQHSLSNLHLPLPSNSSSKSPT